MSIGHNGSSGNKGYYVPPIYVLNPKPLYSNAYFHLINPEFDAEVAEKFLNGI